MPNPFLLTTAEAASELDCSASTIHRLVKQQRLTKVYLTPSIRRGGCPRITRASLDLYLASLNQTPYSRSCIEASATQKRSSVWPKSTPEKTRHITGVCGNDQMAQELGKKLGVL